jgi:hypothetical protein
MDVLDIIKGLPLRAKYDVVAKDPSLRFKWRHGQFWTQIDPTAHRVELVRQLYEHRAGQIKPDRYSTSTKINCIEQPYTKKHKRYAYIRLDVICGPITKVYRHDLGRCVPIEMTTYELRKLYSAKKCTDADREHHSTVNCCKVKSLAFPIVPYTNPRPDIPSDASCCTPTRDVIYKYNRMLDADK